MYFCHSPWNIRACYYGARFRSVTVCANASLGLAGAKGRAVSLPFWDNEGDEVSRKVGPYTQSGHHPPAPSDYTQERSRDQT